MEMNILTTIIISFATIFGLAVGSFYNALEYRLKHKKNIFTDRSRCIHCNHVLSWLDLIPVASFIALKGRCRYCKGNISIQYPLVEIATALLFVLAALTSQPFGEFLNLSEIYQLFFELLIKGLILSLFLFFALYDAKHFIVPNSVVLPLIAIFFFIAGAQIALDVSGVTTSLFFPDQADNRLIAGGVGFLFFLILILVTKGKAMGGGDSKFAALMGLVLGVKGLIVALYIAFITGAVFGIFLAIKRGKFRGQKLPFIPFLSLGSIFAFLYGDIIFDTLFPNIELFLTLLF